MALTSRARALRGPEGMTIDAESGVLSWIPAVEGIETVDLGATNPAGTASETLTITVELPPPPPDFGLDA